jgi:hypothetical protein
VPQETCGIPRWRFGLVLPFRFDPVAMSEESRISGKLARSSFTKPLILRYQLATSPFQPREEARRWLDKAQAWLDQYGDGMPARAEEDLGWHFHNWLEAHVLRREAEALIPSNTRPWTSEAFRGHQTSLQDTTWGIEYCHATPSWIAKSRHPV